MIFGDSRISIESTVEGHRTLRPLSNHSLRCLYYITYKARVNALLIIIVSLMSLDQTASVCHFSNFSTNIVITYSTMFVQYALSNTHYVRVISILHITHYLYAFITRIYFLVLTPPSYSTAPISLIH